MKKVGGVGSSPHHHIPFKPFQGERLDGSYHTQFGSDLGPVWNGALAYSKVSLV